MSAKTLVFIGMLIGSSIGGYIPILFGLSFLSLWSLIGNAVGGILGVIIMYKISNAIN